MSKDDTLIFRVSLDPKLYREIEISGTKNLHDLAAAIVRSFDFDFDHAFGFYSKVKGNIFDSPVRYELFADIGESDARSVKRTRIADAFPSLGARMTFLFDYGDDWQFAVEVVGQGRREAKVKYPRLLKSLGQAPEQYPDPDDE